MLARLESRVLVGYLVERLIQLFFMSIYRFHFGFYHYHNGHSFLIRFTFVNIRGKMNIIGLTSDVKSILLLASNFFYVANVWEHINANRYFQATKHGVFGVAMICLV